MSAPRILLIEDNDQNAYLARYLLQNAGLEVILRTNGHDGMAEAAASRPDLVLLDIQLPEMDGYTIAQRLKADPATADIPLVAVSSFAMPGEKARALALGFTGYIEKPINALGFAQTVKGFLQPAPPP